MRNEIYIVHTKYGPAAMSFMGGCPWHFYSFCPKGKFVKWIEKIISDFPGFKLRCVRNEGITKWIEENKEKRDSLAIEYRPSLSRD